MSTSNATLAGHAGTNGKLTAYESLQVRQIAAWKSEPPNPLAEMFKTLLHPGARMVGHAVPDDVAQRAIEKAYDVSQVLAGQDEVKREAGITSIEEMRHRPLEECDRLAERISHKAQGYALAEGAATGAGGVLTTLLDIPLLFILALRTIVKIGHCYGYPLNLRRDHPFVLGVLLAATSSSLEIRRRRLDQLHDVERMLIEEAQQDVLGEEVASLLFQLEVFEGIPGVGAVSGALLNVGFIRRVDRTARRVFQERWLRDHGKVQRIAPAHASGRSVASGWTGAISRAAYAGSYYSGFALAWPFWALAPLFRPSGSPLCQGVVDGASAASRDASQSVSGRLAPTPA
jgi:hypothetical protein